MTEIAGTRVIANREKADRSAGMSYKERNDTHECTNRSALAPEVMSERASSGPLPTLTVY
jgi:hypothetical protein